MDRRGDERDMVAWRTASGSTGGGGPECKWRSVRCRGCIGAHSRGKDARNKQIFEEDEEDEEDGEDDEDNEDGEQSSTSYSDEGRLYFTSTG